jgi:outer membrane scaffolding protein for murein synthesis (MipA/OmpV family)
MYRRAIGWKIQGLCVFFWAISAAGAEPAPPEAPLPLWEAGAGAGSLWIPAYKGSGTMRTFTAPLPYFVYRGETLRTNRDGVGLKMLGTDSWKLDLSLSGALPVQSSGTRRNGMQNLPLVGEIGSVLKYNFVDTTSLQSQLRLPLRYATGLHTNGLQSVGWISDPGLWVSGTIAQLGPGWQWGGSLNMNLQSRSYNNFYYGVGAADAAPGRRQFLARGGYAGSDFRVGVVRRYANLIVSGFAGASDISGASFRDSPLVERTTNLYAGAALIWVFQRSATVSKTGPSGDLQ